MLEEDKPAEHKIIFTISWPVCGDPEELCALGVHIPDIIPYRDVMPALDMLKDTIDREMRKRA